MIQVKNIVLIILLAVVFSRCTEIYNPVINSNTQALIVEGLITNEAGPFNIRLTTAVPFTLDSVSISRFVTGAKVSIIDKYTSTIMLSEVGKGNYILSSSFKTKIGNSYKLHIETTDGNIYESGFEPLLSPQTFDSIRGYYASQSYIDVNNNYKSTDGGDIRVDLFGSVPKTTSPPLGRFNVNVTVQYTYEEATTDTTTWHWFYFGWKKFDINSNENITDERSVASGTVIKNHSLGFVPFGMSAYSFDMPPLTNINYYYLRINQYTINTDSYNFYKGANNQLTSSGKLFDPVTAQLYGNMKCINNPSKIVLGLFEVSSVTRAAFTINILKSVGKVALFKKAYVDIPDIGGGSYKIWDKSYSTTPKDSAFIKVPFPSWWNH
jgi:hypothetical protein